MNVTFWAALLFGISIAFALLGTVTPLNKYLNNGYVDANGNPDITLMFTDMINQALTWNNAFFVGAFAIGALASGLNLLAILPLGALIMFMNLAVFPIGVIRDSGLPPEVTSLLTVFITTTEIIIVFSLVRGNFN